eukprot:11540-Heterococcus_DN1.PRE.1
MQQLHCCSSSSALRQSKSVIGDTNVSEKRARHCFGTSVQSITATTIAAVASTATAAAAVECVAAAASEVLAQAATATAAAAIVATAAITAAANTAAQVSDDAAALCQCAAASCDSAERATVSVTHRQYCIFLTACYAPTVQVLHKRIMFNNADDITVTGTVLRDCSPRCSSSYTVCSGMYT